MNNENKLSPVTIYLPVSVKDDNPNENESVFVITEDYGGNIVAEYKNFEYIDPNLLEEGTGKPVDVSEFVTHYLKKQSSYIFDRGGLEGLLGDVMGVAYSIGTQTNHVTFGLQQCKNYSQSLFAPDEPEAPTLSRNLLDEAGLWEDKNKKQIDQ